MKYLKSFEKLLKYTDPIVINHPLLDFCKRLENVLIKIKKLDNHPKANSDAFEIRKSFNDSGNIKISYTTLSPLFVIELNNYENNIQMNIKYSTSYINNYNENCTIFFDFLKDKLKKYISGKVLKYTWMEEFIFNYEQLDNIIQEIEKFPEEIDIYKNMKKYNL